MKVTRQILARPQRSTSVTPHSSYGDIETGDAACFLCGIASEQITAEHVFPKWLQSRYNLWTERIDLLNKTTIDYRSLKIPCCTTCNNVALSQLESKILQAVTNGYLASQALDARLWYLWAGKIYYGILRKEVILQRDRTRPFAGGIVDEAGLKSFRALHLFLQGIRGRHEFSGEVPYSVLLCNLHDLGGKSSYGFRDNLAYMTLAIRMGEVGVIVAFEDSGITTSTYGQYVKDVRHRKLHPLQFDELYARVSYQTSLIESRVNYLTSFHVEGTECARTETLGAVHLRERSQRDLHEVVLAHVSQWVKSPTTEEAEWAIARNLVPTWMTDDEGELVIKSLAEWKAVS